MKKLNTKEFIQRSIKKHGDFYDYGESVYTTYRKPVIVICPIHGKFTPLPSNHMKGTGCLSCSHDNLRMDIATFVDRANKKHNNVYDYTKTCITNMNQKVIITCPEHGDFEQRAASHLDGSGCIKCAGVERCTTEEFISKANKKHNNKYTYSNVVYVNTHTKVNITCFEHGDFSQTPVDHLRGCGCTTCAGTLKVTTEQFIRNAVVVHGNRYDYSKTIVSGMNNNVDITCDIHGKFSQRPADHQRGVGCPTCSFENHSRYNQTYFDNHPLEKERLATLYFIEGRKGTINFCKVGVTLESVSRRFSGKCNVLNIMVELKLPLYRAWKIEQLILTKFVDARFKYQNLRRQQFAGWTECFSLKLKENIITELHNE